MSKGTLALVVDDDPRIRMLVSVNLEERGYRIREASNGLEAVRLIESEQPQLLVLDLVMPGMNGREVCAWVRERWDFPIIVLSAVNQEDLKVQALDAGADDFITKPFGQEEFMARVRAVMRRTTQTTGSGDEPIQVNTLVVNLRTRRAFVEDQDLHLTKTEFALLAELAQHLDAVLTHDELLARVWGVEYRGSSHYLHVYFGRIRKKIGEDNSAYLESVPGIGYILHSRLSSTV